MKKYDLLVVGNGFDLHLGYKTKYTHFCDYLINNQPIRNKLLYFFYHAYDYGFFENEEWTSFEQLLCRYIEFLNHIFTSSDTYFDYETIDLGISQVFEPFIVMNNINKLDVNYQHILDIGNPLDGFADFYWFDKDNKRHPLDTRISSYPNIGNKLMVKIRRRFRIAPSPEDTKKCLVNYLKELLNDSEQQLLHYIKIETSKQPSKSSFLETHVEKVDKLVSFNYSHTAEFMYSLTDLDVAHVHGDIDSQIVLGIENQMFEGQILTETTPLFSPFFKKTRRFLNRCNEHFKDKILDNINSSTTIAIFGHSLDKSDKSIFVQLFKSSFKCCDIYYFGKEADYRSKLVELVGPDVVQDLNNEGKVNFIPIKLS